MDDVDSVPMNEIEQEEEEEEEDEESQVIYSMEKFVQIR